MIVHAAGESSPGSLPDDTRAVVLAAPSAIQLDLYRWRLAGEIAKLGRRLAVIVELDPPYHGQLMALGLPPMPRVELGPALRILKKLPLYAKEVTR